MRMKAISALALGLTALLAAPSAVLADDHHHRDSGLHVDIRLGHGHRYSRPGYGRSSGDDGYANRHGYYSGRVSGYYRPRPAYSVHGEFYDHHSHGDSYGYGQSYGDDQGYGVDQGSGYDHSYGDCGSPQWHPSR